MQPVLISPRELARQLDNPDIKLIDASWYSPGQCRDPCAEYKSASIPGAVFFDIEKVSDRKSPLPHMLPPPDQLASHARKLGIGEGHTLVVYNQDAVPLGAARFWWMMRLFGFRDILVLDGGMSRWREEGYPVGEAWTGPVAPRHFTPRRHMMMLRELPQIRSNLDSRKEQIVDAREPGRFAGLLPEPRPGLRPGRIPGSVNLFYRELFDSTGRMLGPDELAGRFRGAGIDLAAPVVVSCGSGISACSVALALERIGAPRVSVYDGSWAEWGSRDDLPVESG